MFKLLSITLSGILLYVNPFFLYIHILVESFSRSRALKYVIALLGASLFSYFEPEIQLDLYRHYNLFDIYSRTGQVLTLFESYFGLGVLIYIVDYLHLSKHGLVFFSSYLILFSVCKVAEIETKDSNLITKFLVLSVLLISIPLFSYATGIRWGVSFSFFLLFLCYPSRKLRFVFLGLSLCFHFASIITYILYLLSSVIKVERFKVKYKFILLLTAFLSSVFIQSILPTFIELINVEQLLGKNLGGYTEGRFGFDSMNRLPIWMAAMFTLSKYLSIFCLSYYFLFYKTKSRFYNYSLLMILWLVFLSQHYILFERYLPITIYSSILCLNLKVINISRVNKSVFLLLLLCVFLGFIDKFIFRAFYLQIFFKLIEFFSFSNVIFKN
ncbi:EpsG family protein [Vibrio parahaemolyticus]|nr:EpsG family protein [Vibrio parahaemolyticus]